MKSLIIDTSVGFTRSGTLKLPVRGPAPAATEADAAISAPQLASRLSRWLQQASQDGGREGSVAELLNLLNTIARLFPQAAPDLLLPLLHKLQPFVLEGRQISDAPSLRQLMAHSGLFLEAKLASGGSALPIPSEDLKLQLFQLLALMDPARLLSLQPQGPVFIDGAVKSAHGLQGSSAYGGKALRGGRVQAYLECSHADRDTGVSDGQLNSWLQQQVEAVLQNLCVRQLQCRHDEELAAWQVELQFQHGDEVVAVPMSIEHAQDSSLWKLAFALDLPQLGKVGIVMTIDSNRVAIDYQCGEVLSVSMRKRHWQVLAQAFHTRRMVLTALNHHLVHL